ncbi:hypothetical protein OG400_06065 [Micromonospora ureilytica]|uniref:hypothetical protein n=1 Tax=Micromonospora ureilytica TaxID=709868 RepID=UPI002E134353|nr:hypothetical protein OG400_06065 [Micromonospora ureilytica]
MPDQFFIDIYRDTEHLTWTPTEQVREHGRRRTRRTRIAATLAGVVAVALVATGAVALAGGREGTPTPVLPATGSPTPTPAPSATPTPSPPKATRTPVVPPSNPSSPSGRSSTGSANPAIPESAMLQASDVPSGWRRQAASRDGDSSFAFSTGGCEPSNHPLYRLKSRAQRGIVFVQGQIAPLTETVTRYSARDAARYLGEVRDRAESCAGTGAKITVLAEDLADTDSVLVHVEHHDNAVSEYLFVRVGDLTAELWVADRAAATRYAPKVAERLCAGTDAC